MRRSSSSDDYDTYRDENEGSIIMSLISQLRCVRNISGLTLCQCFSHSIDRVGMDLSKVTFPTFVLEPRSMLERITGFMAHPDLIFGCALWPFATPSSSLTLVSAPSSVTARRSDLFVCFNTT